MSSDPQPSRDVRMRGFLQRTTVAAACEWIDAHSPPLESVDVPLSRAHGRVLAGDVAAPFDVPAFDRSAMDGYALRGCETEGAGDYNPLPFRLVGESLAGKPFSGAVAAGCAVRIMTGASLPEGTDAVVPAEYASERDGIVEVSAAVPQQKNVSRRGEDVQQGTVVLTAGRRLRPQDVGLMASLGRENAPVVRAPGVRVMVTGNELVEPGKPRRADQIYEANSYILRGMVERDGGELESVRRLPDDREALRAAMVEPGADVVLISGGSSVGAEDHAPVILAEVGELAVHGVSMRPSSPAGMGRIGRTLVFLLPGNPVSCLCAYDFLAGRALRRLAGQPSDWPYRRCTIVLERKIASVVGRVDYCRLGIQGDRAEPLAIGGASILSSTTRASGFAIVPAECEGYPAGARIDAFLYDR